ncbi:MAG: WecB/TagA/CpsF family glycosyltransferase [Elusimicrobiota bacterium]
MQITNLTKNEIIKKCKRFIVSGQAENIVTINSLMLRCAWHNTELSEAISSASLITADSIGVFYASLLLDGRRVSRYPGIEMMEDLISLGMRIYMLGSKEGIAEEAVAQLKLKYTQADICGIHHGYFTHEQEDDIISAVNSVEPDILFVGLDMPRQEIWIAKNKKKIKAKLIIGVGGSFDVISGKLARAPVFFRNIGIEWLWRMILQPWRVIRIIKLPIFFLETIWRFVLRQNLFNT